MSSQIIETAHEDLHAEEPTPRDSEAWREWVAECLGDTVRGYCAKPDWLKRDANGERSIARDYAKRELLELVQNAADAAAENGGHGRVRIEITTDGLCVANTGMPFSASGVRSLMTAHTSDKPERQTRLIGAKGLGFRALLNWTAEPYVSSGALDIAFSRAHAGREVDKLVVAEPRIARLIARHGKPLIPILAFPSTDTSLASRDDPRLERVMQRAAELRAEGYDTVVAAPFDEPKAHAKALEQLAEFRPDFLLFVEALDEIVMQADGRAVSRWTKLPGTGNRVDLEIAEGDRCTTQEWTCGRRRGTLADPESPGATRDYALAIAVRHDAANAGRLLHCYFPTDIPLPFPALFHATLELDSNRKLLSADSELNPGVLAALAQFYAELLVELREAGDVPNPIRCLLRNAAFPAVLGRFEEQVYQAAALLPLIPTHGGSFEPAAKTRVEPAIFATYLPARLFPGLASAGSEGEREVIKRLQVPVLTHAELVETLRRADLTLDERAAAIVGIARTLPLELHFRSLVLDSDGRPLGASNAAFPPPASGEPPELPSWASARFVDAALWEKINSSLGGTSRDQFEKLASFGINELSASGIIASLRRQASQAMRRPEADKDKIRRELLQTLFELRRTMARESQSLVGSVEVLTVNGEWRDAGGTHLSAAYGGTGPIVEALYTGDPSRLVAAPATLGLAGDPADIARFLQWLGVKTWPTATFETVPIALRPVVIDALPEQFEVSAGITKRDLQRAEMRWNSTCWADTEWIAGLDTILSQAPSAAILAWLAHDERFDAMRGKPFRTRFRGTSATADAKPYHGPLPDLVRHSLATRPWLAVESAHKVAPYDAMVVPGVLSALFHKPVRPTADDQARYGLSSIAWQRGLAHAEVPQRLTDLAETHVYRLLEGLEARNPAPEVVRRLYAQILSIEDFDPKRAGEAADRFRSAGTVQIRKGDAVAWAPVATALHLDRDNFPLAAREHLAIFDVPRRSAAEVEARFGVAPISRQDFSLTVTRIAEDEGPDAALLSTRFEETLPFIRTLRHANSVDIGRLRRLEALKLRIVRAADLAFSFGTDLFEGQLEPGKYLLDADRLLVCIDPAESRDEVEMRALTAISDGLAELFGLASGDEFEKLLFAASPTLRMLQLRRLLGSRSSADVEELIARMEAEILPPEEPYLVDAATLARASMPGVPQLPAAPDAPSQIPPPWTISLPGGVGIPGAAVLPPGDVPAPVPVPPALAPPAPPAAPTGVIATALELVSAGGGGGGGYSVGVRIGGSASWPQRPGDVAAPSDAEAWTVLFEQSEGRFPIPVGRLQGHGAYGCDCLSFATDADRTAFQACPEANTHLIARFIEVKSGAVRLTANELASARRNRERYFIYQLSFRGQERTMAHLAIVTNPLRYRDALARECEVYIDQIPDRILLKLNAVASPTPPAVSE